MCVPVCLCVCLLGMRGITDILVYCDTVKNTDMLGIFCKNIQKTLLTCLMKQNRLTMKIETLKYSDKSF